MHVFQWKTRFSSIWPRLGVKSGRESKYFIIKESATFLEIFKKVNSTCSFPPACAFLHGESRKEIFFFESAGKIERSVCIWPPHVGHALVDWNNCFTHLQTNRRNTPSVWKRAGLFTYTCPLNSHRRNMWWLFKTRWGMVIFIQCKYAKIECFLAYQFSSTPKLFQNHAAIP